MSSCSSLDQDTIFEASTSDQNSNAVSVCQFLSTETCLVEFESEARPPPLVGVFLAEFDLHIGRILSAEVRKLANYLRDLELEVQFLSNKRGEWKERIHKLLSDIFESLNSRGECSLFVTPQTSIHLRIGSGRAASFQTHLPSTFPTLVPGGVAPYLSPALARWPEPLSADSRQILPMDVLAKKVLAYVDGSRTVAEIAACAAVDVELVARCVQDLVIGRVLRLFARFAYRDVFACDCRLRRLYVDSALMQVRLCTGAALGSSYPSGQLCAQKMPQILDGECCNRSQLLGSGLVPVPDTVKCPVKCQMSCKVSKVI